MADFLAEEFLNLDVRRIVLSGDPADMIVQFAHIEHSSLIVLPTYSGKVLDSTASFACAEARSSAKPCSGTQAA